MEKRSEKDFIKISAQVHNNFYDYSKVNYVNNTTKVEIICPKHGSFYQIPKLHIKGSGCPKCSYEKRALNKTKDKDDFVNKANEIHSLKYDYSKSVYVNCDTPLCIICPEHGEFWQTPTQHYTTLGCPKCVSEQRKNREEESKEFIKKCQEIYGDKFSYEHTCYINSRNKILVTCPKHGDFEISPLLLTWHKNAECPICRKEQKEEKEKNKEIDLIEKRVKRQKKTEECKIENFIKISRQTHHIKYDYSKVESIDYKNPKICIICPKHGEFWQDFKNHKNGCDCPICSNEITSSKLRFSREEFIEKAKSVHGDKYDYSKVDYKNNNEKVCIICPEHGEFWQKPSMHYNEHQGCPQCALSSQQSYGENDIYNVLAEAFHDEILHNDRTILEGKELDIYIPSKNIGIEYNGCRWHSDAFLQDPKYYHLKKQKLCNSKGIRLIQIFEDEYKENRELIINKIKHICGIGYERLEKIVGRKTIIKDIDYATASEFLDKNHIQKRTNATIYLGSYINDILIGVMLFTKRKKNIWELVRFATDINVICQGVGGKLLKHFIRNYDPSTIYSFGDRRWLCDENNNIYTKLGFYVKDILPPDYKYTRNGDKRIHKFNFRKQKLHKKYGFPLTMTESEMAKKLGYSRIYDCGLIKFQLDLK